MKYPISKYTIITHQHPEYNGVETIAFSTYAGKVVYGKAICRVEDSYDEQFGQQLAVARCAAKIAKKRKARAKKLHREAQRQMAVAQKYLTDMTCYLADAEREVNETSNKVTEIIASL